MTVRELIDKLNYFDGDMIVVYPAFYETVAPYPVVTVYKHIVTYRDENATIQQIPAHEPFIKL